MSLNWFKTEMIYPVTNDYYSKDSDSDETLTKIRLKDAGINEYEKGDCYINLAPEATILRIEPSLHVKEGKKTHYSIVVFSANDTISVPMKSKDLYETLCKYFDSLPKEAHE